MTPEQITDIIRQALYVSLQISTPMLMLGMIIGFGISVFQSVTQINEMTLTFVPKILIFTLLLAVLFPWILKIMIQYTTNLLVYQWDKIVDLSTYAS
jgi:flagellar biosynthetic protein FliQ